MVRALSLVLLFYMYVAYLIISVAYLCLLFDDCARVAELNWGVGCLDVWLGCFCVCLLFAVVMLVVLICCCF